jgi:hypothetical protein
MPPVCPPGIGRALREDAGLFNPGEAPGDALGASGPAGVPGDRAAPEVEDAAVEGGGRPPPASDGLDPPRKDGNFMRPDAAVTAQRAVMQTRKRPT